MKHQSPEIVSSTPQIYGLYNRAVYSDDIVRSDGRTYRYVQTVAPAPDRRAYRETLEQRGLIVGERIVKGENQDAYALPLNARSLALEALAGDEDRDTYTDADLMYDLGELAGTVARYCSNRVIVGPKAEEVFALVDFASPNERQLFLVPGAESLLSDPIEGDIGDVMDEQMRQFSSQFGRRFEDYVTDFVQGYGEAQEAA